MKNILSKAEQNRQFLWAYRLAFDHAPKRKNWNNIFALWHSAASQGYKRAQFYVGTCYDHGQGVKKDTKEAFKWYLKAAKQGHMESQYNIGFFLEKANS
jgi:TPR repeat protein